MTRTLSILTASALILVRNQAASSLRKASFSGHQRLNNLVTVLLDLDPGPNAESCSFDRQRAGWEPGRLYSFKMFVCDYNDLVTPKARTIEEAKSTATVLIEGAEVDQTRSFTEVYASNPEPKIPGCITYHWKIFRATSSTASLTVSDRNSPPFGQEQAFNFLEIQPYRE
jgi:hypothetical protein